ncbi:tetratricopeptide repeat-containing sensor histidine kinase [Chitinophaga sp. sic0106]|uniref:ATP-binding protein n=1 Tax=Chitinophaga sp. sic0106 TaxID=2854785 RepID=UPI001C457AF9|nr:tetratricopeptide repeat-containing sensor histidine kinase [Chitinophaga sp. sic0106]MBV7529911.1 tetratricopeptide repeat-containing sensor histidine kinase [Chitinophaga sp. sic0106]
MLPANPLRRCLLVPLYLLLLTPAARAQSPATDSLEQALHQHTEQDKARIDLLNTTSRSYFTRNPVMAEKYAVEALEISQRLNYTKGKIWAQRNLALVENTRGHLDKQMQLTLSALKLAEAVNDEHTLSILYNDMGNIFTEQNSPRDALIYLHKSLVIKNKLKEAPEISKTLNNIGSAYLALHTLDSALHYLHQAEAIKLSLNDQRGLAYTYENLGLVAMLQRRLPDALRYHELSSTCYHDADNQLGIVKSSLNLAEVQTFMGNFSEAEKNLAHAFDVNSTLKNVKNDMIYYKIRYELDSARKDYQAAFQHFKAFTDRNMGFFNLEKSRQISRSQEKYEAEKKQQENELLKKEQQIHLATIQQQRILVLSAALLFVILLIITFILYRMYKRQQVLTHALNSKNQEVSLQNHIILEQNTTLESLNQVKDKIFSVISHDLRSPLAILEGLLFLLKDEKIEPEQFRYYTDELWRDVKNTAYMMDNMLQWASNQMKGIGVRADDFDFTLLLNQEFELLQTLARQKDVALHHEINGAVLVYGDPEMIRMVVRNLINNAIKFTPGGGRITVSARIDKTSVEVMVRDNGTGIPIENQHRIFSNIYYSTNGTRNEKGCGLGLHLSKDFVERNNGRIWFHSTPGSGSSFSFTVPLSEETDANVRGYTLVVQNGGTNGMSVLK